MRWRRLVIVSVAIAAVLLAGLYLFRAPLSLVVAGRVVEKRMAFDVMSALPDGLHVGLCGTGSPFPDEERSGPCTLVVAGKRLFLFDAGTGSARVISRMGFNTGRIEARAAARAVRGLVALPTFAEAAT